MKEEQWITIPNHPDYKISNLGTVKSFKRKEEVILKPMKDNKGYLRVDLDNKTYKVHRLVASCFLDNPNDLPQVNHKDENKENNCVTNLEWCDNKYNANYGSRVIPIIQYDLEDNFIKEWKCMKQAGLTLNISVSHICNCCKGKRKSAGGYRWQYKNKM